MTTIGHINHLGLFEVRSDAAPVRSEEPSQNTEDLLQLRDRLAGHALTGLALGLLVHNDSSYEMVAEMSYRAADAMLKAREKVNTNSKDP